MLRPNREMGYCFRVDTEGSHVAVMGAGSEEELYVRPGWRGLKAGGIVPRRGKTSAIDREAEIRVLLDEGEEALKRPEGTRQGKRRWVSSVDTDASASEEADVERKTKIPRIEGATMSR